MATTNPITGTPIVSKANNSNYEDNYDAIFKKKPKPPEPTRHLEPCTCGHSDLTLESTGGSHYIMEYVVCHNCKREGAGEFGIDDAINAWNKSMNRKI